MRLSPDVYCSQDTQNKDVMTTLRENLTVTTVAVEGESEVLGMFGASFQFLVAPQPGDAAPCV